MWIRISLYADPDPGGIKIGIKNEKIQQSLHGKSRIFLFFSDFYSINFEEINLLIKVLNPLLQIFGDFCLLDPDPESFHNADPCGTGFTAWSEHVGNSVLLERASYL